ncbi:max dimerization protein 3 isoform X1 [Protopterus annectens]|uniref:max dimerization protein 3 isoform X1 n=1 Tax=Protopterus annectens TaxID=7888 RepID=UPI001CFBACC7|nr:max dimerization protein 3 isoform X1 [Protopterus annectens]
MENLMRQNIQVLLKAVEYVEMKSKRESEHGYASVLPLVGKRSLEHRNRGRTRKNAESTRNVHNELEKHRRAQLRWQLEELRKQIPHSTESSRHTTLTLLQRAKLLIKKLEDQDQKAVKLKEKLKGEQQSLQQKLQQLLAQQSTERLRANSLDSTATSSDRSDSDREDVEIDVEGIVFIDSEADSLMNFHAGGETSLSSEGRHEKEEMGQSRKMIGQLTQLIDLLVPLSQSMMTVASQMQGQLNQEAAACNGARGRQKENNVNVIQNGHSTHNINGNKSPDASFSSTPRLRNSNQACESNNNNLTGIMPGQGSGAVQGNTPKRTDLKEWLQVSFSINFCEKIVKPAPVTDSYKTKLYRLQKNCYTNTKVWILKIVI